MWNLSMTTVQQRLHNTSSVDMSNDEIHFAERLGDDDIDIDIDLETGQNDEDYILDDVNSDEGNEDTMINNDDVMIDDENVSYSMDDVEAIHHEHIEMEDADLFDRPAVGANNLEIDITLAEDVSRYAAGLDEAHETNSDKSRSHEEQPLRDVEAQQMSVGQNVAEEKGSLKNIADADFTDSSPTFPQEHVLGVQKGADQHTPGPYSTYSHSFNTVPEEQGPVDEVSASESAPIIGQIRDGNEVNSGEGDDIILGADKIVVTYQDMEYALFSTAESEDPDTFFLKDGNLVNGSLGNLLAGLRSVIHEDLGSEDELCLTIEDLGIEISETCISVHEVIFASVINLHQMLLRNDGLETPATLHITLSTKPDFAKRLASLATGAAAGKGISEVILWDESSEILQEDGNTAHVEGDLSSQTSDQNIEASNESLDVPGNPVNDNSTEDQHLPEDNELNQNLAENGGKAETPDSNNTEEVAGPYNRPPHSENGSPNESNQGLEMAPDRNSNAQGTDLSDHSDDSQNHDEEGDLIDYEDEEYELIHENPAPAIIGSNSRPNEENSAPDIYSPPPTAEDDENEFQRNIDAGRSPSDHFGQDPDQDNSQEVQDNRDPFSGFHYAEEHENDGDFEQDSKEYHISYDEGKSPEEGDDGSDVAENAATNAEESSNPLESDHEVDPAEIKDDVEELEYGTTIQDSTDTHHRGNKIESITDNQKTTTFAVSGGDEDGDEIGYEEDNILDSNESERTLVADQSGQESNMGATGNRQDDEINYESDSQEDSQSQPNVEITTNKSLISNGLSGKRQRGDADDVAERTSKHSKRARS